MMSLVALVPPARPAAPRSDGIDSLRASIGRRIADVKGAVVGMAFPDIGTADSLYVNADAYEGSLYGARSTPDGRTGEEQLLEFVGQLRAYFLALPPDRFPQLQAHAEALTAGDGNQRFEFGLDMLIDGLERHIPRRRG